MRNKGFIIGLLSIISLYSYAQETVLISNTPLNTCNARIVDDGGLDGNYSETNYTMTVCADAGNELFIVISSLRLSVTRRGDPDRFRIYEGNSTLGNVVFDSNTDPINDILQVNNSCITIDLQTQEINVFGSRGSGFDLLVTCTLPETCSDGILNNGEVLVDCGGPNCIPCYIEPTCEDNVVFNGDFELDNTPVCTAEPDGPFGVTNQIPRIWYDQTPVSGWLGTTDRIDDNISFPTADYFNNSCTNTSARSCMSGSGSVGYWAHFSGSENPEYIQTQLLEPLIAGREYCISVIAETGQSDTRDTPDTDKLGFWFHNNTYTSGDGFVNVTNDNNGNTFFGPGSVINAQPQVVNSSSQVITRPCREFKYSFCAEGGEQYLVVGNFIPGGSASGDAEYVAIDDLVVRPSCPLDFDLTILGPTDCNASAFDVTAETANQQGGCIFSNDFTYQWLLNGVAIPGETNATLTNISPDMDNVYSVDVTYNAGCSSLTKNTVFPGPGQSNNAGSDSTLTICALDSSVDLFTMLGGTPEAGGTWSPALNSGTGVFDPSLDAAGDYTYSIMGTPPCPDASATITVIVGTLQNAGEDGSLTICNTESAVDLFSSLEGTPNTGGVWSPILTSTTGVFDPAVDASGTYTYSVTDSELCPAATADVVVTVNSAPDAGEDGSLSICNTEAAVDLFSRLGGTPNTGGVWSPTLTSTTGVFDPTTDASGTYTYTLTEENCPTQTSEVEVLVGINQIADAGDDVVTCSDNILLNARSGAGQWACDAGIVDEVSRADASLSGIMENSTITCSWTVTDEICGDNSSEVTINRVGSSTNPTITFQGQNVTGRILDICEDETNLSLSGAEPSATETGNWTIAQGTSITLNNPFTQANQGDVTIQEPGTTLLSWTISGTVPGCEEQSRQVEIEVHAVPVAGINVDDEICEGEDVIIILDSLGDTDIGVWMNQLQPTPVAPPIVWTLLSNRLVVGENPITYSVINDGCAPRVANAIVTVLDKDSPRCIEPEKEKLIAPNVFTPNGDGENDTFIIKGMESYPNATVLIFNRWGAKIYESDDYLSDPWNGGNVPDGAYYFVIEFDPDAEKGTGHSGVIHVVR